MGMMHYVGIILKGRRKELRLSLDDVAALSGISRANIANIERGRCETSCDRLFTLLVCLDIDPRDIFELKRQILNCDERYLAERSYLLQKHALH